MPGKASYDPPANTIVHMQLTVLVDNNTAIDKYYLGEPGLSFYIEDDSENILFDCGYSDVCKINAERMGVDLSRITTLVFSHGHDDHTGGLAYLQTILPPAKIVAHPDTFREKRSNGKNAGSIFCTEELAEKYQLYLSREPQKVSDHLTFLGEIPKLNDFEPRIQFGEYKSSEGFVPDFVMEDSALVYEREDGIFIITGCSHAGICNIIAYAKNLFQKPILGIIGGFHLKEVNERTNQVIGYLETLGATELYPCHCTSFAVRAAIHQKIPCREVSSGMKITW